MKTTTKTIKEIQDRIAELEFKLAVTDSVFWEGLGESRNVVWDSSRMLENTAVRSEINALRWVLNVERNTNEVS